MKRSVIPASTLNAGICIPAYELASCHEFFCNLPKPLKGENMLCIESTNFFRADLSSRRAQVASGRATVMFPAILKKSMAVLGAIFVMASSCHADSKFTTEFMNAASKAMSAGDKIVVLFHTNRPLESTTAQVASAMMVRNPNAISIKQQIVEITARGYDKKTKCGFVVGKWWRAPAGYMENGWDHRFYDKVKNAVDLITIQYARDGDLKTSRGTPGSNENEVIRICLPDWK